MICSISTGKSSSNWLDRLRSNKGFPTGDNLDLDHFLRNNDGDDNPNPEPNSSESTQSDDKRVVENRNETTEIPTGNGDNEDKWFGIMSNVLSDLFNMGGSNGKFEFSGKKSSRKQTNPKFCVVSTTSCSIEEQSSRKDGNAQEESEMKEKEENVNNNVDCGGDNEDDICKAEERELFGYSRNEVVVIDTSCTDQWKCEKLVYRKRNVWKVREKKGKSRFIGRKKRKGNGSDGNVDGKKKAKLSNSEANREDSESEEFVLPSKRRQGPQDDIREEVFQETSDDDLILLPKRRFSLSKLPKKSSTGVSSTIKGTPTSKKKKAKSHKSCTPEFGNEKRQIVCNEALITNLPFRKEFQD